jgi:uncharacterized protein (DUF2141 family)
MLNANNTPQAVPAIVAEFFTDMRAAISSRFSRIVIMNISVLSVPSHAIHSVSVRPTLRAALGQNRSTLSAPSRHRAAAILSMLIFSSALATTASAADLTVKVDGVRSAKGTVVLELDDSAAGWDDKAKPAAKGSVKAEPGGVTYTFKNLPAGTYAVGVFQDENDNGKLDTNFLGIPKEGYGFSNNTTAMRKPTFAEAHFDIGEQDISILIHLAHAL